MVEYFNKVLSSTFVMTIISAFAVLLSYYFNVQKDVSFSIATLIIYFLVLGAYIYKRIKSAINLDITKELADQIRIVVLYNSDENNSTFLSRDIVSKYSGRNLQFLHFKTNESQIKDLESDLEKSDGLCCIWNSDLQNNFDAYFKVIEKWLIRFEAQPFIIISESNDSRNLDKKLRERGYSYKVLNKAVVDESLVVLLSRAISRTKRFVSNAKTWKTAFFFSSTFLILLISILSLLNMPKRQLSYRDFYNMFPNKQISSITQPIPKNKQSTDSTNNNNTDVLQFLNAYINLKSKEISLLFSNTEVVDISLWRNINEPKRLDRVTSTTSITDTLPMVSVAGCACQNNVIAAKAGKNKPLKYWDISTGEPVEKIKYDNYCKFYEIRKDIDKSILCIGFEFQKGNYNVISLSCDNEAIIDDERVKKVLYEIVTLTALIPESEIKK